MNRFLVPCCVLLALALTGSHPAFASNRSYLEISPEGREELTALFSTLEESLEAGLPAADPVVVILHGSEASSFTRDGYQSNRALVDQAALLDAYQLIDVRMCETWMNANGIELDEIPAFIDVIPFAPEEIMQLEAEGYLPYDSVNI